MYQKPKVERFGTFRELTQRILGETGGDEFGTMCGNNTIGGGGGRS